MAVRRRGLLAVAALTAEMRRGKSLTCCRRRLAGTVPPTLARPRGLPIQFSTVMIAVSLPWRAITWTRLSVFPVGLEQAIVGCQRLAVLAQIAHQLVDLAHSDGLIEIGAADQVFEIDLFRLKP